MSFDARAAAKAAEANYPPFQFIGMDGEAYYLPHPMMVDPGLVRRAQAGDITNDEMLRAMAPEAAAAIDQMMPVVQRQLVTAWRAAVDPSLEELGKELEQSSPTRRSGEPSKPISQPAASTSGSGRSGSSGGRPKRS